MTEWFIRNARETRWTGGRLGKYTPFGERAEFPQVGVNISVLDPGEPMTMYHREGTQEGFLVLRGECLLIVEGEERPLRQWDYFHCPPGVPHAIVGAGDGPSLVLALGSRVAENWVVYPAEPVAQRHGAGVEVETSKPAEAYAGYEFPDVEYEEGWLP